MTPLVLVHGFMGGSAQWPGVAEALAGHTEVVAVDLPGFGANANLPPINRIEGFADWVIAYLRERGVETYHLLGHSMGGMIAQEIARRDAARVRQLILYGTGPQGVLPGRFETIAASKRRATVDGARATARRIAATWFLKNEVAQNYEVCAGIAELADLNAIHAGLDAMEAWSGADLLDRISQDTLILWGDQDRSYDRTQVDLLVDRIPNSNLTVFPGCAHVVHLEEPEAFLRSLLAHLEK